MWVDDLNPGQKWSSLWHGYIRCECGGIRGLEGECPACGAILVDHEPIDIQLADGTRVPCPRNCYAGGEAGYQDYMYPSTVGISGVSNNSSVKLIKIPSKESPV